MMHCSARTAGVGAGCAAAHSPLQAAWASAPLTVSARHRPFSNGKTSPAAYLPAHLIDRRARLRLLQRKGDLLFHKPGLLHGQGPSQGYLAGKLSFRLV